MPSPSGGEGSSMGGALSRRSRRIAARQAIAEEARRAEHDEADDSEDEDFEMESDDSDSAAGEGVEYVLAGGSSDDDGPGVHSVEQFLIQLGGFAGGRRGLSLLGKRPQDYPPIDRNPPPLRCELSQELDRATSADVAARPPGTAEERRLAKGPGDLPLRNASLMLWQRAANAGGSARGWAAGQRCHLAGLHFRPNKPLGLRARMQSRAYIGQHSHRGDLFVAAFQADKRVRVYDTERGWRLVKDVHARNIRWTVTDTTLSQDQQSLLYASITPTVHLVKLGDGGGAGVDSVANVTEIHEGLDLDVVEGERQEGREPGHFGVFGISWAADGQQFAAGTGEYQVLIFDMHRGKTVTVIDAHEDDVNAVCFLDDSSNLIASGSDDHLIKVWDRRALGRSGGRPAGVLVGHTQGLTHLDPKGDGRYLLSNCKDQTAKIWDVRRMLSPQAFAVLPSAGQAHLRSWRVFTPYEP